MKSLWQCRWSSGVSKCKVPGAQKYGESWIYTLGFNHLFRRGAENQVVVFPDLVYDVVNPERYVSIEFCDWWHFFQEFLFFYKTKMKNTPQISRHYSLELIALMQFSFPIAFSFLPLTGLETPSEEIDNRSLEEILNSIPPPPPPAMTNEAGAPRLMITHIVNQNFKSYAGEKILGPFHKVFDHLT